MSVALIVLAAGLEGPEHHQPFAEKFQANFSQAFPGIVIETVADTKELEQRLAGDKQVGMVFFLCPSMRFEADHLSAHFPLLEVFMLTEKGVTGITHVIPRCLLDSPGAIGHLSAAT